MKVFGDRRGVSAAVRCGLAWTMFAGVAAAQTPASPTPAMTAATQGAPGDLDPNAPLADLPDLGVAWPDLSKAPAESSDPAARTGNADALRYGYAVEGIALAEHPKVRDRFDALSALRANAGKPANAAQIDRRAREDAELLVTLLRGEGYYDAQVTTQVAGQDGTVEVTLNAEPGTRYTFDRVDLGGLGEAGLRAPALRDAFGVAAGAPVDADAVAAGTGALKTAVGREGFAFGNVGEPAIVVDHATKTATLDLSVAPGRAQRFGRITMARRRVFGADHVQEIARFKPGEPYDSAQLDDLRRALIQTGLVSAVTITPTPSSDPEVVDLAVALERAPPRTIAGELGYGTGEGARAEASWTHRNLFPPEGALTLRGVLGTQEQLASVGFRRNNFHGRDRVLNAQVVASNLHRQAYRARTLGLSASLERQSNIFFQKKWTWSVGGELLASDERDVVISTGLPRQRTYLIGAIPASLAYDGSDDLLNPSRGFRLAGRISPELSFVGKAFGYTRTQIDASAYQPVGGIVLAERIRLGTIFGAPRDAVAPSRRFYAGGGGSVRGYGYQDIGPRDINNDPVGGRSLAEFSLEARVKAFGNFGLVPFLDGGNISTSPLPRFSSFRFGTGIGVRYYSSFGPIRLDIGTPINPRRGDPKVAVYVSLGQAF